jgi:hypothetical protein
LVKTTIKAHPRKGTRGVKKHTRDVSKDKKKVPSRKFDKEKTLEVMDSISVHQLYLINTMEYDKPLTKAELDNIILGDSSYSISEGLRNHLILPSSGGYKLAPTKTVKDIKKYLADYGWTYPRYYEFSNELSERRWEIMTRGI